MNAFARDAFTDLGKILKNNDVLITFLNLAY